MATMTSPTFATSDESSNGTPAPDAEVLERPRRRRFSAESTECLFGAASGGSTTRLGPTQGSMLPCGSEVPPGYDAPTALGARTTHRRARFFSTSLHCHTGWMASPPGYEDLR